MTRYAHAGLGEGGHETTVPLPDVARTIVTEYLAKERSMAAAIGPPWWASLANAPARRRLGPSVGHK